MRLLICIIVLFLYSKSGTAQTTGRVMDAKTNEPLVGATVKSSTASAITDANGEFNLTGNDPIAVSYPGYETVQYVVKSGDFIHIALQQSANALSEVVVSAYNAKRALLTVAAPVTVLTKADLLRADGNTLIPILNAVPGVKLEYYTYGDYRLNIRGGALAQPSVHSSGYRMYWNDIPITTASGGNPLGGLDLNFINSMEILKGPGSAMYGAGFGGTVLVNTERATQTGTVFNADVMAGGFGTFRATTGVRSDWNKGNIALQYTHSQSNGFRPMTDTKGDILNLFGQLHAGSKGTFSYLVNYENRNMNIAGDLDLETFKTIPKTVNTVMPTGFGPNKTTVGAGYQHRFSERWSASIGGNYQNNKGEFVLSFPDFALFDKEPSNGFNTRSTVTFRKQYGRTNLKINAGLEYGIANNEGISYNGDFNTDTARITNVNTAQTNQLLAFAQAELILPGDWYLTIGASYNNYDYDVRSGTNNPDPVIYQTNAAKLVPRFSLLKKVGTTAVYVAAGQGFSPPAAGIFNDFLNFDGSVNANLRASFGWNLELGSRGNTSNGRLFYDVAAYRLLVQDAIISRLFEISPGVNAERKTNAGKVQQLGLEALVGLNLSPVEGSFWQGSQLRAGYTFNDFEYTDYRTVTTDFDTDFNPIYSDVDYSGQEVPGTIPHTTVVMLDLRTKPGLYLNYTLNAYAATFLTDQNTSKAEAYNVMNLRIGYTKTFGRFTLHPYAGVNNMGSTVYSSLTAYNSTFGGFFNPGYRRQPFGGLLLTFKL